jgi:hypothetical protein
LLAYHSDIKAYILSREESYMIDSGYLRNHRVLTYKKRGFLVRHPFKIYIKLSLKHTTLFLAVHYMDLYFSRQTNLLDQFETIAVVQTYMSLL